MNYISTGKSFAVLRPECLSFILRDEMIESDEEAGTDVKTKIVLPDMFVFLF